MKPWRLLTSEYIPPEIQVSRSISPPLSHTLKLADYGIRPLDIGEGKSEG